MKPVGINPDSNLVEAVEGVDLLQLAEQIAEHTAGDLIGQALGVGGHGLGHQGAVLDVVVTHDLEVVGDLLGALVVQIDLVAQLTQRVGQGLGGGLGGAAGEGRNGGVDNVHAGFHGLQVGHEGKTGGGVGVQVDGQLGSGVLDGGNQIVSFLGTHDTGHILDADGGSAHFLQFLHHFHVLLLGVDGRGGVGQGAGGDGACLYGGFHGDLQVVRIVEGVEDTDDVNAVLHGLLHEELDKVIGVVGVTQNILTPQQHLQLGVGHGGADLAQTLPGIFVQVAQAAVEGGAAPALHGVVAGLVHGGQNLLKIGEGHTGGHQGLVGITNDGFHKLNFLSHLYVTSVDGI